MKEENETQSTWETLRAQSSLNAYAYHEMTERVLEISQESKKALQEQMLEYFKKEKERPNSIFSSWENWSNSSLQGGLYETITTSNTSTESPYFVSNGNNTAYYNLNDYYKHLWSNPVIPNARDVQNHWKTSNKKCVEVVLNETKKSIQIIYKDHSKILIENIEDFEQVTEEVLEKYCNSPITIL